MTLNIYTQQKAERLLFSAFCFFITKTKNWREDMITVYTKPSCPQCDATKRELNKKGLVYSTIDVTNDMIAYTKITEEYGYRSVPVVVTQNGHWAGFQIDKLDSL